MLLNPDKFLVKDKYLPKNKRKITGQEITDKVTYTETNINLNTPIIITYEQRDFKIHGSNYVNQFECTWKCSNYRKKLKNTKDKYCEATIKGKRNEKELNNFNFFLKKEHSLICSDNFKNICKNNNSLNDNQVKIKVKENISNVIKKKIITKDELEEEMKIYILNNKSNGLTPSKFINYGNDYIKDIIIENYEIKPSYFKNLYYKLYQTIFPSNSEEIYNYSLKLNNGEDFCRSIIISTIITREKKKFEHKHILFFSDYDIRRLIASNHVLIDGTFSFPKGFSQTIIIMYLDTIVLKMIPGVFAVTNNKCYEGYKCIFTDLLSKINMYTKSDNTKLKFISFTSDFEYSLYSSFNDVFKSICPNIRHIGCLYHYMANIEKKLRHYGYGETKRKKEHDEIIKFFVDLPFINNINITINDKIDKFKKKYPIDEEFYNYFNNYWIPFFEQKILVLKDVDIKLRTNNSLENFNKLLKKHFFKKGIQEPYLFLDVIMDEVIIHENYINKINSKSFDNLAKSKIRGTSIKKKDNDTNFLSEIKNLILDIESNFTNNINNYIKENNIEETKIDEFNNINRNNNIETYLFDNSLSNRKKTFNWLINYKCSCSLDSFYTIFIFSLIKYIKSNNIIKNDLQNVQDIYYENFKLILNFCDLLIQNISFQFIKFYEIYLKFQKNISNNILLIKEEEIGVFNPITLCYRPFYNISFFKFKYKLLHTCTGICQFANNNNVYEDLNSTPFIDFTIQYLNNNNINSINDFLLKGYFGKRNVLCNENLCIIENTGSVQTFKYKIIEYPFFLSINISIQYEELNIYRNKIVTLFNNDFKIANFSYSLLGVVLMPSNNHFICLFKNKSKILNLQNDIWYLYDDLNGNIKSVNDIGKLNILNSNNPCLFIYVKNI